MLSDAEQARVLKAAGWAETRAGAWLSPDGRSFPSLAGAVLAFGRLDDPKPSGGGSPLPLFDHSQMRLEIDR
jgi:hypothetical protein